MQLSTETPAFISPITFHRLIVIEWLGKEDEKTGSELVRHLLSGRTTFPVELVKCNSKLDVLAAIDKATETTPILGVPVLHIEAHGFVVNGEGLGFRGPGENGLSDETLRLEELENHLRNLNYATRFNLLVVAAACLSDTVLYTIRQDLLAPFAMLVGFSTKVSWSTLENALKALYSALFLDGADFLEAFSGAIDKLGEGEKMGFTPVARLVRDVVRQTIALQINPENFSNLWIRRNALRRYNLQPLEPRADALRHFQASSSASIDRVVRTMLGYDAFPEIDRWFQIDSKKMVETAFRSHNWNV